MPCSQTRPGAPAGPSRRIPVLSLLILLSHADINASVSCQLVDNRERLEVSERCPGDLPASVGRCYDIHVLSFLPDMGLKLCCDAATLIF